MTEGLIEHEDGHCRCWWPGTDPLYVAYHDTDWGVPEWDDRALFEKLILDGFQAGLSWITILRKRDQFRSVFDEFAPERIARYKPAKIERLLKDPGIVRNRAKVEAAVASAQAYLRLQQRGGLAKLLWQVMGHKTQQNRYKTMGAVPTATDESLAMSKLLQKEGFRFVGPTICYAFMQAVGMVND